VSDESNRDILRRISAVPEVSRPEYEDLRDYAALLRRLRAQARAEGKLEPVHRRRCANPKCRKVFVARHNEPPVIFRRRRYCSQQCGSQANGAIREARAPTVPLRMCALPGCGRMLTRREGEPLGKFATRRYCDRTCQWTAQRGKPRPKTKAA
jgi:hypothetical protein